MKRSLKSFSRGGCGSPQGTAWSGQKGEPCARRLRTYHGAPTTSASAPAAASSRGDPRGLPPKPTRAPSSRTEGSSAVVFVPTARPMATMATASAAGRRGAAAHIAAAQAVQASDGRSV